MAGLMVYLAGPGRSNEHTEPHLVAGDTALMVWHDDNELGRDSALAIARHVDRPRSAFEVSVRGGHVWHCSLSLRAEEGVIGDERWAAIADDFVSEMGFDDHEGTKAPCRWVAVHHGQSTGGNDHIHLVVNLVREDGTKASLHNDRPKAQTAARALEVRYGLQELESVRTERATRGFVPAEREAQARARARAKYERGTTTSGDARGERSAVGWSQLDPVERSDRVSAEMGADQPRAVLALKVRAAAAASRGEGEFVRRMRRDDLLVRGRYADGRTDVVTGYSVAERPVAGERPIWYGGGHLGRDLTLPRLRDGWEDTPTGATDAAAEWTAAKRGRRVVTPGRETVEPTAEQWASRTRRLTEMVDRLHQVPIEDRDTWATVARQTAGALAAWSRATEDTPGEIAGAAEALSRSAQTFRKTVRPELAGTVAISGAAMLLAASAAAGGKGAVAQAVMVRQLIRLTGAVIQSSQAANDLRQAQFMADQARDRLRRVHDAMTTPGAGTAPSASGVGTATLEQDPAKAAGLDAQAAELRRLMKLTQTQPGNTPKTRTGSPVPNPLEPSPRVQRSSTTPAADRGPER